MGIWEAGFQQLFQSEAFGELGKDHQGSDNLGRCGNRGIPCRTLLGIQPFGRNKLASSRIDLADADLLVAGLLEFLVLERDGLVDIGDTGFLVNMVDAKRHGLTLLS